MSFAKSMGKSESQFNSSPFQKKRKRRRRHIHDTLPTDHHKASAEHSN